MLELSVLKSGLRLFFLASIVWFCGGILPVSASVKSGLTDDQLLGEIQGSAFQYFVQQTNPQTGLVADSASNFEEVPGERTASIAATGFALAAYPIGVERAWMDATEAKSRTVKTLRFFLEQAEQEHGFFYHYLDPHSGKKQNQSEVSPIDTAFLIAGMLLSAEYFEDSTIRELSQKIYERVDWPWMLNGGKTFALAWKPSEGFDKRRWDHYDESMILYLLAIGSPTHPITQESWKVIRRPVGSYLHHKFIQMPPLFTHQYSHIWIDFRNKHDDFADYFENSVQATLANRQFCIDQAANNQSYGTNSWGLTASNGPFGYKAHGAPPGWYFHDGTIAPTACGASIVFTPKESMDCLRYFYEHLGDRLWGRYGFSDAFNLDKNWFDDRVIAIDQGAMLLMIENYRTGLLWALMEKNTALRNAMKTAGFVSGPKKISWPEPPVYSAFYKHGGMEVDGYLRDWSNQEVMHLNAAHLELGEISDEKDLQADLRFAWDETALYFAAKVKDESHVFRKPEKNIWMNDTIELFFDPESNGLYWEDPSDYQLGFSVDDAGEAQSWSWFQGGENPAERGKIEAKGFSDGEGYIIEGAVRWDFLGFLPEENAVISFSPAIHDADRDRSEAKIQWFFRNEEAPRRFNLGKLVLKKTNREKGGV